MKQIHIADEIRDSNGNVMLYSKEPISITYTDLYALTQTSGLTVGQRCIINDYQTVHEIPNSGLWAVPQLTTDGRIVAVVQIVAQ